MPIYAFACPSCNRVAEHILNQTEASYGWQPVCSQCVPVAMMHKVLSTPAAHRLGGVAGKLATAEKIKKRNDAYYRTKRGIEEQVHGVASAHKRLGL